MAVIVPVLINHVPPDVTYLLWVGHYQSALDIWQRFLLTNSKTFQLSKISPFFVVFWKIPQILIKTKNWHQVSWKVPAKHSLFVQLSMRKERSSRIWCLLKICRKLNKSYQTQLNPHILFTHSNCASKTISIFYSILRHCLMVL